MDQTIIKRLGNLLSVKSLVTLTLTAVFAYTALTGTVSQEFMTVYSVVIAFYFGTQSQKIQNVLEGEAGKDASAGRHPEDETGNRSPKGEARYDAVRRSFEGDGNGDG